MLAIEPRAAAYRTPPKSLVSLSSAIVKAPVYVHAYSGFSFSRPLLPLIARPC